MNDVTITIPGDMRSFIASVLRAAAESFPELDISKTHPAEAERMQAQVYDLANKIWSDA